MADNKKKPAWESVVGDTSRLAVPGGWLYISSNSFGKAMCFVPEMVHKDTYKKADMPKEKKDA